MKKNFTNKRVQWLLVVAFTCIVYLIWATFSSMKSANRESAKIKWSLDRLLQLENCMLHIQSVETGQRGYVISGDQNFLDPYYKGLGALKRDTAELISLEAVKEKNKSSIRPLLQLVNKKLLLAAEIIEIKRMRGFDSVKATLQAKAGKQLMDSISRAIVMLENEDKTAMRQSDINRMNFAGGTSNLLFMLAFLFIAVVIAGYLIINNDFKKIYKAEQQLKFNASIIRNVSDPIITTDIFNKITNWNTYAGQLFGFTEAEVLGKDLDELLGINTGNEEIKEIRNKGSEKDFWKGELMHFHKNGEALCTEVTVSAIIDEEGDKTGTVSVIRDITQRKSTEQKLQRLTTHLEEEVKIKAAELNNIFERITDAFIALDNNWNYTYVNKKAAELHNRSVEQLIGKNMWQEYPDVTNEPFYEALHVAKQTNKAQRLQLHYSTTGKWFEDLIYPSADGISVYYHDITESKKAELALEQTHKKLSYHINNTPMGVVEFDKDLNILQWSNQAQQIFGWSREELTKGQDLIQMMVFKGDRERVAAEIKGILETKVNSGFTLIHNCTKDGRDIYCEWYNSLLKDEHGNAAGIMSLVHDVTRRMEVKKELENAEIKFRGLVEQSMVGVYIMQYDKFTYINPKLAELCGYPANEIIEHLTVPDLVHPDDREMVTKNIALRMEQKVESLNYELRIVKKNGEIFYAEVFGTITQYLGNPAIIGTLIDITEKKESAKKIQESQEALKKSNERFLLVAKATNDAVWDWDIASNRIWGNEVFSGYFNIPVGKEVGFEDFIEKIHPGERQKLEANLNESIKNKRPFVTEEFRFKMNEQQYLSFRDRASILFDEDGNAVRMLGAMQDISEQKRNEQQILLEKELSDSIINSLPGVFYLFNRQGIFYRWNKNLLSETGFSENEMKNMKPEDLFFDDEKEMIAQKIASVFINGEDSVEAHLKGRGGTKTLYYFTGRIIQYEGETCLMGVGMDLSEKVRSQKELERSEERYRTIIEQASDGIFISDLSGNYLDVNSNGVALSGYSKEELLSLTIYDLTPPEDLLVNPPKFDELFAGKVTINERVMKTKDGSLKEIEISAKLLGDGRFIGIVRDITARKRTQEVLRASEEKYRLLFNQNPMPMWMISLPERKFLDVNNAAIEFYGYSKEEFLQMTAYDIRPPHTVQNLKDYDFNNADGSVNYAGIWEHHKKDGTVIKVNIITHNIFYEGRNARLVLANDVTQKIMAEEALNASHEQLRLLATHLEKVRETERTHIAREIHDELGQQLTGLKMDISWLNRKLKSQDEEVQQKITETIQLIDATVKTVRRIATELRPSILDDLGLLAAMEWQSEEFEKRSEISCVFTSNVSDAQVAPDLATGIFRIYQESLTNVSRHAEATAVASFLELKNSRLSLTIKDNGKGFVEKEISSKKTLGLLGMKERTNLLGGSYEITSKPGEGTSVLITVPLKDS
jgi:PAS domain S-box-containing protein